MRPTNAVMLNFLEILGARLTDYVGQRIKRSATGLICIEKIYCRFFVIKVSTDSVSVVITDFNLVADKF
jgi:hypothetical protein